MPGSGGMTTGSGGQISLEHGLPGTVIVEIHRMSPAALLLRTIGWTWGRGLESAGG